MLLKKLNQLHQLLKLAQDLADDIEHETGVVLCSVYRGELQIWKGIEKVVLEGDLDSLHEPTITPEYPVKTTIDVGYKIFQLHKADKMERTVS